MIRHLTLTAFASMAIMKLR